MQWNTNI